MIKPLALVGVLLLGLSTGGAVARPAVEGRSLGRVHLFHAVMADGNRLPAGTYVVRLTDDDVPPALGQSAGAERWVEFVAGGQRVGRELATVVSNADIAAVGKAPSPGIGQPRVELLKGGDYLRVWIRGTQDHYFINLRVPS